MKIVDLIRREMILPAIKSTDKGGVIKELAAHLSAHHPDIDRGTLTQVLTEREALASTAIGEGVAIPHGKLSAVNEIVACLGRCRRGMDFDSMDGQPTYLFFVLVAPAASTGAHLKALARISRVFRDAEFRSRLLAADDADLMFSVIAEEDSKYQ